MEKESYHLTRNIIYLKMLPILNSERTNFAPPYILCFYFKGVRFNNRHNGFIKSLDLLPSRPHRARLVWKVRNIGLAAYLHTFTNWFAGWKNYVFIQPGACYVTVCSQLNTFVTSQSCSIQKEMSTRVTLASFSILKLDGSRAIQVGHR